MKRFAGSVKGKYYKFFFKIIILKMILRYSGSAMAMVFLSWFPRKCRAGSREAELTDRCLEGTGAGRGRARCWEEPGHLRGWRGGAT